MKLLIQALGLVALLMPSGMYAQAPLRIFHCSGAVLHHKDGAAGNCVPGTYLREGESLELRSGKVTLIDAATKRVSLEQKGTYSYRKVATLFSKAHASPESKFLEYVWAEMTHGHTTTTVPGGVRRGDGTELSPADSSFMIGANITFRFPSGGDGATFRLMDAMGRSLLVLSTRDSILTFHRDGCPWWTTGTYSWQVELPPARPMTGYFTVPDDQWILRFETERARIGGLLPDQARDLMVVYDRYRRVFR